MDVQAHTDQQYTAQLDSTIIYACWNSSRARGGATGEIEVRTAFVGDGSTIQIRGEGEAYGPFGGMDDTIFGNRYAADLSIPEDIEPDDKVWFTARLPAHGLDAVSERIPAVPPIRLVGMEWSQPHARRGDILTLRADFLGMREITDCIVHILEHDQDGNHDPIVAIPSEIRSGRLELQWEFQYYEDTDEIPTEEELQEYGRHYNPPEYFYVVEVDGVRFGEELEEEEFLSFRDWLEFQIKNANGIFLDGIELTCHNPDGTSEQITSDCEGRFLLADLDPGKYRFCLNNAL